MHGVADLPLERSECFPLGLPLGHLPLEVDPTLGTVLADLGDRHHVHGMIDFPRRLSRWTTLPPDECSMGATPAQEANWSRLVN